MIIVDGLVDAARAAAVSDLVVAMNAKFILLLPDADNVEAWFADSFLLSLPLYLGPPLAKQSATKWLVRPQLWHPFDFELPPVRPRPRPPPPRPLRAPSHRIPVPLLVLPLTSSLLLSLLLLFRSSSWLK